MPNDRTAVPSGGEMLDDKSISRADGERVGPPSTRASPYLTCTEAAAYLRTSPQGIYSYVKRGRLRPMPGSRKLLFTREALDACLRGRCRR